MKLAISTAVACLLLIGGNGAQGATSLRRRTNEENKNERELIGLGLFWGRVPTYRPTPEPTQQSDSPSSEPTPPKYVSYFDHGKNGYPQVSQPKPYSYPEVSHNPYGHPVVYYDPYGYPVVPRTATVKPTPFATVKPTPFPTPNPTTPRTPWPTGAPTETLTLAKVICDPDNRHTFLGFCIVLQATGLDIILNGFQELPEEYQLPDDFDELGELLCECELPNMWDIFSSSNELVDLICSAAPSGAPSEAPTPNFNRRKLLPDKQARKIDVEKFVGSFLNNTYNIQNDNFEQLLIDAQGADIDQLFTVFVPSNNAMASLQPFPNSQKDLENFGAFHVLVGEPLKYDNIGCGRSIEMLNGGSTNTTCKTLRNGKENKFQVGQGNIDTNTQPLIREQDYFAFNGIIQVIGKAVLQP